MPKTNPPQHFIAEHGGSRRPPADMVRQTGENTAPTPLDVADPHPSDEGHPYDTKTPGGTNPPKKDLGPNSAIHNGSSGRRPHNAGSGPE